MTDPVSQKLARATRRYKQAASIPRIPTHVAGQDLPLPASRGLLRNRGASVTDNVSLKLGYAVRLYKAAAFGASRRMVRSPHLTRKTFQLPTRRRPSPPQVSYPTGFGQTSARAELLRELRRESRPTAPATSDQIGAAIRRHQRHRLRDLARPGTNVSVALPTYPAQHRPGLGGRRTRLPIQGYTAPGIGSSVPFDPMGTGGRPVFRSRLRPLRVAR